MTVVTLLLYVYMRVKRIPKDSKSKTTEDGEDYEKTEYRGVKGRRVVVFLYLSYLLFESQLYRVLINV